MDAIKALCTMVVVFVAGAGFLFGQLFAGVFSPGGTLAGAGGLAAAWAAWSAAPRTRRWARPAAIAALAGALLHAYEYYSRHHVPGNYYAWFLTGPFMLALVGLFLLAPPVAKQET